MTSASTSVPRMNDTASTSHHLQEHHIPSSSDNLNRSSEYHADSPDSSHSPHSPSHYPNEITSPSSSISVTNDTAINAVINNANIQFKNYTVRNPPGNQQMHNSNNLNTNSNNPPSSDSTDKNAVSSPANFKNNSHYPTPNNTPTPQLTNNISHNLSSETLNNNIKEENITPATTNRSNSNSNRSRSTSLTKSIKNDKFPVGIARDANGYPILSREFVVRRISEGETGRLKEELKCEACGKGYKHITSLAKHLWEHTAEWQTTKKLLISKHQQAQLLEAASILCSIGEKSAEESPQQSNSISMTTPVPPVVPEIKVNSSSTTHPKLYPISHNNVPMVRRKSKSENGKASKFGGKRRSKSFVLSSVPPSSAIAMSTTNSNGAIMNNIQYQNNNHRRVLSGTDTTLPDLDTNMTGATNNPTLPGLAYGSSSISVVSSVRRGSESISPPIGLRRSSMHISSSMSTSASRRGSILGNLIKEEKPGAENSLVIYDSEDED